MAIIMNVTDSIMYNKQVVVVNTLPTCAKYLGSDKYFEYWLGIDNIIYGL